MHRTELVQLIINTVDECVESEANGQKKNIDEDTQIFGPEGCFDSVGLVSLILSVEQDVSDSWGAEITIADERAMSQSRSPFRTVGRLADYILVLLQEQQPQ